MKVRELLVSVAFRTDTASLMRTEQTIASLKARLGDVEDVAHSVAIANNDMGRAGGFAGDAMEEAFERMAMGGNKLNHILFMLKGGMMRIAAFAGLGFSVQQFIAMGDQWKVLTGQLKNVVDTEKEALEVRDKLFEMSGRTRQGVQQAIGLFTSVSRSAKELGKSTDDILLFTEDIANALLVGGGSAESQQAALIQLGQALGSGTLRGDELNSILEQAPVLAKTIADGMGTSIGQLRKLGADGKLTSQALFDAVRKQSDALKKQLGNTPWTVQQALGLIQNALLKLFGMIEEKTHIISYIAQGLAKIADIINMITKHVDLLIILMKIAAFWAGVFWIKNRWSGVVSAFRILATALGIVNKGYALNVLLAETSKNKNILAAVLSARAWMKTAVAMALANAPLVAVIALFTLLALAVEDFYVWVQGGDSVLGRMFGNWNDFADSCKKKWDEFTQAIHDFLNMRIIDIIKNVLEWIGKMQDKIAKLDPRKRVGDWWNENVSEPFNEKLYGVINGVANGATAQGPQVDARIAGTMGKFSGVNKNTTNNITINATTNASAKDIGNAVFNSVNKIDDHSFPAVEG